MHWFHTIEIEPAKSAERSDKGQDSDRTNTERKTEADRAEGKQAGETGETKISVSPQSRKCYPNCQKDSFL